MIHIELPKRKQNRLTEYDYSTPNAYFITICTDNRKNLFWKDVGAAIGRPHTAPLVGAAIGRPEHTPLTDLGRIAQQSIADIPKYYPAVSVDHYVIMPNHIHLLLQINTDTDGRPMTAPTISTVINQAKGIVSKKAGFSVWQKGFYDHVIRSEQDYLDVWNYIEGNPGKWTEDSLYTPL